MVFNCSYCAATVTAPAVVGGGADCCGCGGCVDATGGAVGEVTGASTEFRSKQFNLITARKKEAVHDILMLGYDVLFSDTDVAVIRDPLPYMLRTNVDYVHSLNYMCTVYVMK